MAKKILQGINEGKPYRAKIISNLADPDAFGAERVEFQDCVFTEVTLANWEVGTLGEEEFPFSYGKAKFLDSIDV